VTDVTLFVNKAAKLSFCVVFWAQMGAISASYFVSALPNTHVRLCSVKHFTFHRADEFKSRIMKRTH